MKALVCLNIALAAVALSVAPSAMAAEASGDCSVPISLGEKPSMSEFADYSDFLVAIMDYKKSERDQKEQRKACPELYTTPPVVWDGPENLDEAVQKADSKTPFDYQSNPTWYDRSTSQSFALQDVPAGTLADQLILASLATLETGGSLSAEDQAALLLLQAINGATEDGREGAAINLNFDQWLLPARESELGLLALLLDNANIGELAFSADGSLTVALTPGGDILSTSGDVYYQTCLSSCGEFLLLLNW